MSMRPPTDDELERLPHILLTSDVLWNPSYLDDEFSCEEMSVPVDSTFFDLDPRVTDHGMYTGNIRDDIVIFLHECRQERSVQNVVSTAKPDLELLRPFFGWLPVDQIK
jgi:hypothetical protein